MDSVITRVAMSEVAPEKFAVSKPHIKQTKKLLKEALATERGEEDTAEDEGTRIVQSVNHELPKRHPSPATEFEAIHCTNRLQTARTVFSLYLNSFSFSAIVIPQADHPMFSWLIIVNIRLCRNQWRDRWGGLGHLNWQRSRRVDW